MDNKTKNSYKTPIRSTISKNNRLISLWDLSNKEDPSQISQWSTKKFKWKCEKGHVWTTAAVKIKRGGGCPYCYGRYATPENNFLIKFPDMAKEWDYEKNRIYIKDVSPRSGKIFYWKCAKGHSWKASPHNRSSTGQRCPYCTNKYTNKDNCLSNSKFSYLLKEWDYEKNILNPNNIVPGSSKKAWWKCNKGHSWLTQIRNRTNVLTNCPYCSKIQLKDGSSFHSMIEAYYYLVFKSLKMTFETQKRYPKSKMISDFYIPFNNTYIEVTSYSKIDLNKKYKKHYMCYLRKIVKKKRLTKKIGARFLFIQHKLTTQERKLVIENKR